MSAVPQEFLPGVLHWTTPHPRIGHEVGCHLLVDAGLAIDPLLPEGEGPEWLGAEVRAVAVTICLHTRSVEAFGAPIHAPAEGLHRWEDRDLEARGFSDGDEIAPGVRAHRLGTIAPDDYVLHVETGPGILVFGDGLIRYGEVGFVPDHLIGDDPEGVKRATVERARDFLDLEFDALLFAHGESLASGGRDALRRFLDAS